MPSDTHTLHTRYRELALGSGERNLLLEPRLHAHCPRHAVAAALRIVGLGSHERGENVQRHRGPRAQPASDPRADLYLQDKQGYFTRSLLHKR